MVRAEGLTADEWKAIRRLALERDVRVQKLVGDTLKQLAAQAETV